MVVGDGQVSMGHTTVKPNARKVRRLKDTILTGFAGSTADAMTLFSRLEAKLEEFPGFTSCPLYLPLPLILPLS